LPVAAHSIAVFGDQLHPFKREADPPCISAPGMYGAAQLVLFRNCGHRHRPAAM
jgi:hypothetical protein